MHTAPVQLQPAQGLPAVVKQTAASAQLRTTMDSAAMRPSSRYVARAACCGAGGWECRQAGVAQMDVQSSWGDGQRRDSCWDQQLMWLCGSECIV